MMMIKMVVPPEQGFFHVVIRNSNLKISKVEPRNCLDIFPSMFAEHVTMVMIIKSRFVN